MGVVVTIVEGMSLTAYLAAVAACISYRVKCVFSQ